MAKSYTQVSLYEKCAFAYHCRYVQRIKEESSPALERGIKVHEKCDDYLKGKRKTLKDVHPGSKRLIDQLKEMEAGSEEFWHYNSNWELVDDWDWLVVKMDAYCIPEEGILRLVDFKTGKMYPTHKEQLSLYATAGFSTYDCETIECIAAYLDNGTSLVYRWKENEYDRLRKNWTERINRIDAETKWKMNPGYHCKWCNYSKKKGGPCTYN